MDIVMILSTIVLIVNMLLAIAIIFFERKDASATWAWVLILFFIPVLGFLIYLFLGQNLARKRMFDREAIKKLGIDYLIAEQIDKIKYSKFEYDDETSEEFRDLIYLHLINSEALLTFGNHIDIYVDGHDKFNQLLEDIKNAKQFIHIQYYIFRYDNLGKKIIHALEEKAKEGVEIRLLYDDLGSRKLRKKHLQKLRENGGEVSAFFPSKFHLINLRLNYRNHRKLVIIDGMYGYIGGFNVGDEYLGLKEKFGYWRDTHLRIQGPAVDAIQSRFIQDWNVASKNRPICFAEKYFPPKEEVGQADMQIVSSGPDSEWEQIKYGYVRMISAAKKSIYIQTPYFIPDQSILDALRIAALSGKDVRIMIPNKPDHPFIYWATLSYVGELLRTGVKVYIYEKGFIHAKTIIVDEKINSVGTANIDLRSFKLNFEVNAFIYDDATSQHLVAAFNKDIEHSVLLTQEKYEERSKYIRFKESISRLLSPIL